MASSCTGRSKGADLYIYPNTITAVRVTGTVVREWLEMSAGAFNRIDAAGPPT